MIFIFWLPNYKSLNLWNSKSQTRNSFRILFSGIGSVPYKIANSLAKILTAIFMYNQEFIH